MPGSKGGDGGVHNGLRVGNGCRVGVSFLSDNGLKDWRGAGRSYLDQKEGRAFLSTVRKTKQSKQSS